MMEHTEGVPASRRRRSLPLQDAHTWDTFTELHREQHQGSMAEQRRQPPPPRSLINERALPGGRTTFKHHDASKYIDLYKADRPHNLACGKTVNLAGAPKWAPKFSFGASGVKLWGAQRGKIACRYGGTGHLREPGNVQNAHHSDSGESNAAALGRGGSAVGRPIPGRGGVLDLSAGAVTGAATAAAAAADTIPMSPKRGAKKALSLRAAEQPTKPAKRFNEVEVQQEPVYLPQEEITKLSQLQRRLVGAFHRNPSNPSATPLPRSAQKNVGAGAAKALYAHFSKAAKAANEAGYGDASPRIPGRKLVTVLKRAPSAVEASLDHHGARSSMSKMGRVQTHTFRPMTAAAVMARVQDS